MFWSVIAVLRRDEFFGRRKKGKKFRKVAIYLVLLAIYNAYLIYATCYQLSNDITIEWCDGLGFLIIITIVVYISLFYFLIVKRYLGNQILRIIGPIIRRLCWVKTGQNGGRRPLWDTRPFFLTATGSVVAAAVLFLVFDTKDDRYRFVWFSICPHTKIPAAAMTRTSCCWVEE